MTRPQPFSENNQIICLYMLLPDGTPASFACFVLRPDGTCFVKKDSIGKMDSPSFRAYISKLTGGEKTTEKKKTVSNDLSEELFSNVSSVYDRTGSIKKTSKELGLSEQKTRKILITVGKYTCEIQQQIMKMLNEKKTVDQISKALNISKGQVTCYFPYAK